MYRVLDVARHIIERCNSQNRSISNLKLQKILYFVQAEFLVTNNQPCFSEEIEAWDFGPVVPEVYHQYKIFGSANIPVIRRVFNPTKILPEDEVLMDGIIDQCAEYSASDLVQITHNQSPWNDNYVSGYNNIIPKDEIRDYFAEG